MEKIKKFFNFNRESENEREQERSNEKSRKPEFGREKRTNELEEQIFLVTKFFDAHDEFVWRSYRNTDDSTQFIGDERTPFNTINRKDVQWIDRMNPSLRDKLKVRLNILNMNMGSTFEL